MLRSLSLFLLIAVATSLHADVGLIVETPTGLLGFLSDVGHVSVWISHGCLDRRGQVGYCEETQGIVLTSTAYWSNPGAAAIPAELFFLGAEPGKAGRSDRAWNENLAAAYPSVAPAVGRKYLGRVWLRGMRVLTFATSAEEDRRVLKEVEAQRQAYRYSYSRRNCAFYAEQVLKLYLGEDFHANRILEFGVETPRALERALRHRLESEPGTPFRTVSFKGSLLHSWRQPPRNICESAIFDPKYAIPLAFYQPYLYGGFTACYGVTRLMEAVKNKPKQATALLTASSQAAVEQRNQDFHLTAFQQLTGRFPTRSSWAQTSKPSPDPESTSRVSPRFDGLAGGEEGIADGFFGDGYENHDDGFGMELGSRQ